MGHFFILNYYFTFVIWDNVIQNTSSILLLLNCIASFRSERLAFAFVDAGCTNNAGLKKVMHDSHAKIFMLDSIGAEKPLYLVNPKSGQYSAIKQGGQEDSLALKNERLVYIISGDKKDNQFVLSRNDLEPLPK
ncbi:hypothetical protein [Caldifermentibacillus hisashii]|uniref:hypothetical protein n=1 Tax=Caldifermentibacillus hisashii TaxID=996558 RepID=UPI0033669A57